MNELYPLKFEPILKETIWGGKRLHQVLDKPDKFKHTGESWEVSGVKDNVSVVSEGFLKGNNLEELIEIYMGDLVGDHVYEKFGLQFPLLIKYIDANDVLSIQVHPNDKLAAERHNSFGKSEMWYVMEHDKDANIIIGFSHNVSKEEYLIKLNDSSLSEILNSVKVDKGDAFFLPAGRIHAIGKGILLAEIQQASDLTYRIYDWNRVDKDGNTRELHIEQALDAIDYHATKDSKIKYEDVLDKTAQVIKSAYFTTNILKFEKLIEKDYHLLDSFIVYLCLEGSFSIKVPSGIITSVDKGETVLIPAELKNLELIPECHTEILEVYIEEEKVKNA